MHLLKLMAIRTLFELSTQPNEEVDAGQVASTGMVAPSYVQKLACCLRRKMDVLLVSWKNA